MVTFTLEAVIAEKGKPDSNRRTFGIGINREDLQEVIDNPSKNLVVVPLDDGESFREVIIVTADSDEKIMGMVNKHVKNVREKTGADGKTTVDGKEIQL
jgi:hypothetical protein